MYQFITSAAKDALVMKIVLGSVPVQIVMHAKIGARVALVTAIFAMKIVKIANNFTKKKREPLSELALFFR